MKIKLVERIEMWESLYSHKVTDYLMEACEWIYNKYEDIMPYGSPELLMTYHLIHIKQSDIESPRPELQGDRYYNKAKGFGRSVFLGNSKKAVIIPRSRWFTYGKASTKREANGINFPDFRSAVIVPTIHELTHLIQSFRHQGYGEVETTQNEMEFVKAEYPDMFNQTDKTYYDEVEIKPRLGEEEYFYKTYNTTFTGIVNVTAKDYHKIKWNKKEKNEWGGSVYTFGRFKISKMRTRKRNYWRLTENDKFIGLFDKKGSATLHLAIILKNLKEI